MLIDTPGNPLLHHLQSTLTGAVVLPVRRSPALERKHWDRGLPQRKPKTIGAGREALLDPVRHKLPPENEVVEVGPYQRNRHREFKIPVLLGRNSTPHASQATKLVLAPEEAVSAPVPLRKPAMFP